MASWWRWTNDPSPKSSFMGFSYQRSDVHQRYDLGRTLTSSAITTLMEMLRGYVAGPVDLLIDLGCGTGRFTEALSQAFDAVVVGVEPAANMLEIAAAKPHPRSVGFVQGALITSRWETARSISSLCPRFFIISRTVR